MNRVAVFVDAGYLFAQGSTLLSGSKLQRSEVAFDHAAAIAALTQFATSISSVPLLRIYWYDGTSTGPTTQHILLAHLSDVKVRLGLVNSVGQQKGVDSLIITDMIALARNGAMSDAVLLSGDEDLRVGVQQAQEFGVRVHLLGIKPSRGSQSLTLLQEADTCHEWEIGNVTPFLTCRPKARTVAPTGVPAVAPLPAEVSLSEVARRCAFEIALEELATLVVSIEATGQVPRDIDSKLLARSRTHLKHDLGSSEKKEVRRLFLEASRARLAPPEQATGEE